MMMKRSTEKEKEKGVSEASISQSPLWERGSPRLLSRKGSFTSRLSYYWPDKKKGGFATFNFQHGLKKKGEKNRH